MIIKYREMGLKPIIGIIIVVVVSVIAAFNIHPKYRYFSLFDKFMGHDLGYSAPSIYNGNSVTLLFNILKNTPHIILNNLRGYPHRPSLERIDLDIKFLDYQRILDDRRKAMARQILVFPSKVDGKIRYKGKKYKANLRLKGDLAQHWRSKHRMSLRVSLKGKDTILDYKKFSLQKPEARQHPFDQTFQALIRHMGNLAPGHSYAKIYVNGSKWGVMNIEEHMSKEMLEKQGRKESLIVRFGNEDKWQYKKLADEPYRKYRISNVILNINVYGEKKYLKQPIYRKWMSYIARQRLLKEESSLYDVDSYSRTLFLTTIWNNSHTLAHANSRQYFNPYTLRLEPITTDQGMFYDLNEVKEYSLSEDIYKQIVATPEYYQNLSKNLSSVAKVIPLMQGELSYNQSYYPLDNKVNDSIVKENLRLILSDPESYLIPKGGTKKDTVISHLPDERQAAEFPTHIYARHFDNGKIDFYNLLPDTVKLNKLMLDDEPVDIIAIEIPGFSLGKYNPISINTELKGIFDDRLSIETEYRGYHRTTNISATHVIRGLSNPLENKISYDYPFLEKTSSNEWLIRAGEWHIKKPITIHGALTISAGTHIRFDENAYMIVRGTLIAEGSVDDHIILEAEKKYWKGLYVIEAHGPSILKNVIIKNTSALEDGIMKLTGGITFYKSDVTLHDVKILGSQAEDALNIVNSDFRLNNLIIDNTESDGFDSDFSIGSIVDSTFTNIRGDAVDFSGSQVQITNIKINHIKDKAISIGEASKVKIDRGNIENIGVGIASKDGSQAIVRNVEINSYVLHAAMAYVKKDFFGQPELKLENCTVEEQSNTYARQFGALLTVDNRKVLSQKINVKNLYKNSVMRK